MLLSRDAIFPRPSFISLMLLVTFEALEISSQNPSADAWLWRFSSFFFLLSGSKAVF
jgi:hypothetical protein